MSKKVLVLMGGFSSEREVSLISGAGAAEALRQKGYEVVEHDLTDFRKFVKLLETENPDVVFNALHGNYGEDGTIQGFLDLMQIPYTHSGVKASVIGMDKFVTKEICRVIGVNTVPCEKMKAKIFAQIGADLKMPYVVKPISEGSSVGVFIVRNMEDFAKVGYQDPEQDLMIEKYIEGKELTVAVWDGHAHVVTELKPTVEFYDYEAKYTDGVTDHILPAVISDDVAQACMYYAQSIHRAIGCNTVSRSDFRYNPEDGVVFLEINTNPGLTPLSLVPEQARYTGLSYEDLCAKLVEEAKCRYIPPLS